MPTGTGRAGDGDAVQPHPSPFAVSETPAQTLQRVLGYKFLSDEKDDRPISITRHEVEDGKYLFTYLDDGQSFDVDTAFLCQKMHDLLPDYNRSPDACPISRQLMERELPSISKDLTRKVMKLVDSVPEAKRDIFMKYVNRGDGITVSCARAAHKLRFRPLYTYRIDLVGVENGKNAFVMAAG